MSKNTPKQIKSLKPNEVFVFGSNVDGNHAGGAAATAVKKFGAIMGQGEGLQGQSYAIPTMEGLDALSAAVVRFLSFAAANSDSTFLVTAIGTGIAGHSVESVAPLFADRSANVIIPAEFEIEPRIIAYKGFDKNLQCRGYQYEIGGTYIHKGVVGACEGGFHACEHPLSVLSFYGLRDGNRYAVVEQFGTLDRQENKTASQKITVKAEIGVPGLIKAAVTWTKQLAGKPATSGDCANSATSGNCAHSATSGDCAHSATSGNYANSATSGYCARVEAKGNGAAAFNAGDSAAKAGAGGAIAIVERDRDLNILAVFASKIGENGIKPDTWYVLKGGKPVEVNP